MRRLTQRQRLAAIILSVVAFAFITFDLAGSGLKGAHGGVQGTLGALYRGTDSVLGPVRRWIQGIPTAGTNKSAIERLQHENAQLRAQLDAVSMDQASRDRLARLQLAADQGAKIVPARVIAIGSGQGFDWTVTLDAGSDSGVAAGMTVTDGEGLVGRVLTASRTSSVVLLAADPGSGVGVRNARSGQLGIARGKGADGFVLNPLDPKAEVRVGDVLRTGPAGASQFITGVSVGTVTKVRVGADGSTSAEVKPTTNPMAVDIVGVILAPAPVPQRAPLTPTTTNQPRASR